MRSLALRPGRTNRGGAPGSSSTRGAERLRSCSFRQVRFHTSGPMRDRPSQTASLVAFLRALADAGFTTLPHFADPTAATLLPPAWSFGLHVAKLPCRFAREHALARDSGRIRRSLGGPLSIGTDLVALRTLLIDEALRAAVSRGVKQVVILGAGLDGRAYRLPELAAVRVFEVDHPATQAYKRQRAQALVPLTGDLRYVAVDFERDDLDTMLGAHGHDPSSPTFFVWEGVVLYLTDDAVKATLRTLAARAASGSDLVATYGTPTRSSPFREVLFRVWGEPPIGRANEPTDEGAPRGLGLSGHRRRERSGDRIALRRSLANRESSQSLPAGSGADFIARCREGAGGALRRALSTKRVS